MKNIFLSMLCLLWASNVWAQNELNMQHEIGGKSVTQKVIISDKSESTKVVIGLEGKEQKEFEFTRLEYPEYVQELKSYFKSSDQAFYSQHTSEVNKYIDARFLEIVVWKLFKDEKGPKAGDLKIRDTIVDVHLNHAVKSSRTGVQLEISDIQLEFRNGYIEQILLEGKYLKGSVDSIKVQNRVGPFGFSRKCKVVPDIDTSMPILFSSTTSVPFSTIKNFRRMRGRLYAHSNWDLDYEGNSVMRQPYIFVRDVLHFKPNVGLECRDYAPANDLLTLKPGHKYELFREKTNDLVSLLVCTDFAGLDEDKPNGLLEFEASRKIHFWSNRQGVLPRKLNLSIGSLQYIRPVFSWTKIEENNRRLELNRVDRVDSVTQTFTSARFATPVRTLNHQMYALGGDLNVFYLDMRSLKSEFFIDYGFRYRRFQVIDSVTSPNPNYTDILVNPVPVISPAHAFSHIVEVRWKIIPEERYGFHIGYSVMNLSLASSGFDFQTQYAYLKILDKPHRALNWLMSAELGAYLNTGDAGNTLFLRWRMNWQAGNQRDSFAQVQFGYNISVRTLFKK